MFLPLLPLLLALPQDHAGHGHGQPAPQAQGPAAPAPAPKYRYRVTPDKAVILDSVGPREKKTVSYEIANQSDQPIRFTVSDFSPGTTATLDAFATPFAPGDVRTFTVTVDPTDWTGWQTRAVRLVSDDPKEPTFKTVIKLNIRPEMAVDNPAKDLGAVKPHESPQIVFAFDREGGDPGQIKLASQLPPWFDPEVVNEGTHSELRLTFRPRMLNPGVHAGLELLKVETNAPKQPQFALSLAWKLDLPVVPEPARVVFEQKGPEGQKLTLKGKDGKPFRILSAEIMGSGFTVGAGDPIGPLPTEGAPEVVLPVKVTADGETKAVLVLHLEGQEEPLKVPLAYLPPSAPKALKPKAKAAKQKP